MTDLVALLRTSNLEEPSEPNKKSIAVIVAKEGSASGAMEKDRLQRERQQSLNERGTC
jgi:hypothetical protein